MYKKGGEKFMLLLKFIAGIVLVLGISIILMGVTAALLKSLFYLVDVIIDKFLVDPDDEDYS